MVDSIDGTASPEAIAAHTRQADEELEDIVNANTALREQFESHGWSGLDALSDIGADIAHARDTIADVTEKVTKAGGVREAYQQNQMVGDKSSLGRD